MGSAFPRKLLAVGASLLALPALGAVAYAAAHAVSNNPAPQRVIPIDSRSRLGDAPGTTEVRGREPEPGDDRGKDAPVTPPTTAAVVHDADDDHGGETGVGDDGPTHDLGDDHGGGTGTTVTTTAAEDDHSGRGTNSGSGSDDSGHGSDDSGRHGSGG